MDPNDQQALLRIAGFAYDEEDWWSTKAIRIEFIMSRAKECIAEGVAARRKAIEEETEMDVQA